MWNFQQYIRWLSLCLNYALLTSNCSNFVSFWARKMLFTKKLVRNSPEFDWYSHKQPLTAKTWYTAAVFTWPQLNTLVACCTSGTIVLFLNKLLPGGRWSIVKQVRCVLLAPHPLLCPGMVSVCAGCDGYYPWAAALVAAWTWTELGNIVSWLFILLHIHNDTQAHIYTMIHIDIDYDYVITLRILYAVKN